ncbi:hypothetical protein J32TS6_41630 [Virgibacillus pantothenticus]|nr:hypothetical protein J32TS6_41630 [Virgibacillus pantothenticus]
MKHYYINIFQVLCVKINQSLSVQLKNQNHINVISTIEINTFFYKPYQQIDSRRVVILYSNTYFDNPANNSFVVRVL